MKTTKKTIARLADALGVHRVSFARIARENGIPGLGRTKSGRWELVDVVAFGRFVRARKARTVRRYRSLYRAVSANRAELMAGVRFHKRYGSDLSDVLRAKLRRVTSAKPHECYSTGSLAKALRVSAQTMRNLASRIPGVAVVGNRLRFLGTDKLLRWARDYMAMRRRGPKSLRVVDQSVLVVLAVENSAPIARKVAPEPRPVLPPPQLVPVATNQMALI